MKNKILLLTFASLGMMCAASFASGPSYQNKDGTNEYRAKGASPTETVSFTIVKNVDLAWVAIEQEAEKHYSYNTIEPQAVLRIDRGYAYHRGSGAGYNKKSVIPQCRSFDCLC